MSRILPLVSSLTELFWRGGADGRLRIKRCQSCGCYQHPPQPLCTHCLSREIQWEPVSGLGNVESFTINYQPWRPELTEPYVIAIIRLSEQADLRLTTNIVGCRPESVYIGQPMRVRFEAAEDIFLPLFEPASASD